MWQKRTAIKRSENLKKLKKKEFGRSMQDSRLSKNSHDKTVQLLTLYSIV